MAILMVFYGDNSTTLGVRKLTSLTVHSSYDIHVRGLSKKFVEFVNKNKTTNPIAFKFVYN